MSRRPAQEASHRLSEGLEAPLPHGPAHGLAAALRRAAGASVDETTTDALAASLAAGSVPEVRPGSPEEGILATPLTVLGWSLRASPLDLDGAAASFHDEAVGAASPSSAPAAVVELPDGAVGVFASRDEADAAIDRLRALRDRAAPCATLAVTTSTAAASELATGAGVVIRRVLGHLRRERLSGRDVPAPRAPAIELDVSDDPAGGVAALALALGGLAARIAAAGSLDEAVARGAIASRTVAIVREASPDARIVRRGRDLVSATGIGAAQALAVADAVARGAADLLRRESEPAPLTAGVALVVADRAGLAAAAETRAIDLARAAAHAGEAGGCRVDFAVAPPAGRPFLAGDVAAIRHGISAPTASGKPERLVGTTRPMPAAAFSALVRRAPLAAAAAPGLAAAWRRAPEEGRAGVVAELVTRAAGDRLERARGAPPPGGAFALRRWLRLGHGIHVVDRDPIEAAVFTRDADGQVVATLADELEAALLVVAGAPAEEAAS